MAARAIAPRLESSAAMGHARLRGVRVAVTLQAEETRFAPHQHEAGHGTVRIVALHTAEDAHGWVLKHKRTAFFHVAAYARFPVRLSQRSEVVCPVGVVAIGAFHQAFRYSVVERHGELRLNSGVALIAESGLRFF